MPDSTYDRSIDQPPHDIVEEIRSAAGKVCRETILLSGPRELADRHREFSDSLVLPYWFGRKQRSRHAYVPAICEACDLMFIGADAFTKTVCNDKELSKAICRRVGLSVANSVLVCADEDLEMCRLLEFPVFAKPNFEGTSLGIDESNICANMADLRRRALKIMRELEQPVLVEEFIDGPEISAAFLTGHDTFHFGATAYLSEDGPFSGVFDWRMKCGAGLAMEPCVLADGQFWDKAKKVLSYFEKTGVFRIDCRLRADDPVIIELTPDVYLGSDGEYISALSPSLRCYDEIIRLVVFDSLEWYGAEVPMGN